MAKSDTQQLVGNISALTIIQLTNYIAPLFVARHLIAVLGLEIYGILAFAIGLGLFFMVMVDVGFSVSASENISRERDNPLFISKYVSSVIIIKCIFSLFAALTLLSYAITTGKYQEYTELFLLILFPSFIQAFTPTWLFIGIGKASDLAYISVFGKIIYVASIHYYINIPLDIYRIPMLMGGSAMFPLVLSWWIARKYGFRLVAPTIQFVKSTFLKTLPYFFSRLGVATYMNLGLIFLGLMASPVLVGAYAIAEQLYKVMQSVFAPITQAIFPHMVRVKDLTLYSKIAAGVIILTVSASIFGYYISPYLVPLILGEAAAAGLPTLNIFLVAIVIHITTVFFGFPLCAILDRVDLANTTITAGVIFYLLGLWVLYVLNLIEPVPLAYVMLFSELTVLIYRIRVTAPLIIITLNK